MRSRVKRKAWSERAVLEFNDSIKLNLLLDFCLFYQLFAPKVGIEFLRIGPSLKVAIFVDSSWFIDGSDSVRKPIAVTDRKSMVMTQ